MNKKYNEALLKNSRQIRYIIFFITVFMIISAVRVYISHFETVESIQQTSDDIEFYEEKIAFMEKFELPYLESDYSKKFIAHEANITRADQKIIKFKYEQIKDTEKQEQISQTQATEEIKRITTPQQAWRHFIQSKLF